MRSAVVRHAPAGTITLSPPKCRRPSPCWRQWSSHRIPSVRMPSTIAADSASLTPITASAAVPAAGVRAHRPDQSCAPGPSPSAIRPPSRPINLRVSTRSSRRLIVAAGGIAGSGRAAVAGGHKLQRLRLGSAHAPGSQAQALRALLHLDHGAHQVAFLAPQLQQAAAMLLAHGVAGGAHVEQHAAILEQGGRGMVGQIVLDAPDQAGSGCGRVLTGHGGRLPALAGAQTGDVRRMVAAVPLVDGQQPWQDSAGPFSGWL